MNPVDSSNTETAPKHSVTVEECCNPTNKREATPPGKSKQDEAGQRRREAENRVTLPFFQASRQEEQRSQNVFGVRLWYLQAVVLKIKYLPGTDKVV